MGEFRPVKLRYLFLCINVILLASCSRSRVLIVTDPFWDEFASVSVRSYDLRKRAAFVKKGLMPEFETYTGERDDFAVWFSQRVTAKAYDSVILTYPFYSYGLSFQENSPRRILLGANSPDRESESFQVFPSHEESLRKAGAHLKELWQAEGRTPLAILWRDPLRFDREYESLLSGWGDQRDILEDNILIIDQATADIEGKLNSFYNRFELNLGDWSLLVAAEPALAEVMKSWPGNETIHAVLMASLHAYLPQNVIHIIQRDFLGMLEASAAIIRSEEEEKMHPVESLFEQR